MSTDLVISLQESGITGLSDDLLKRLSKESKFLLWSQDNIDEAEDLNKSKKTLATSKLNKSILKSFNESQAKALSENLNKNGFQQILAPVKLDSKITTNNFYKKRLFEILRDDGVAEYFRKHFDNDDSRELVEELCELFEVPGVKDNESTTKKMGKFLTNLEITGVVMYFEYFADRILVKIINNEEITKKALLNPSKRKLVEMIVTGKPAPKTKRSNQGTKNVPKSLKAIGKKKPIEDSDFWQIYQHYERGEIEQYCYDNLLKTTGSKKEMTNRILAWREGDKESTMVNARARAAREPGKPIKPRGQPKKKPAKKAKQESESESEEETKSKKGKRKATKSPKGKSPAKKQKTTSKPVDSDDAPEMAVDSEDEDARVLKVLKKPKAHSLDELKKVAKHCGVALPEKITKAELVDLLNSIVLDLEDLEKYSYEALKSYCQEQKISTDGDKAKLIKRIREL
eukprot:TRINITY_DN7453_c0_g1_i2.p1 TRINITY_DN7453_c0_g1~~TRINITY_DN7453_c0_g1_i2.p1  ORF type:complete len:458 (+),score=100.46 TRINITY_DN7453_c0_g1_i2:49-1422(+)